MEQKSVTKVISVKGMTCSSCELKIEKKLKSLQGVIDVKAMYISSNVYVTYDVNLIGLDMIIEQLEKLDFEVVGNYGIAGQAAKSTENKNSIIMDRITKVLGVIIILISTHIILKNALGIDIPGYFSDLASLKYLPELGTNASLGLLFLVGLLTSFHCVGMCGGIVLSQCVGDSGLSKAEGKSEVLKPTLMYNIGRVISYTVIGGIAGGIGAAISFSGHGKGIVAIIGGLFMIIMGINMLGAFPVLRKLRLSMPKAFGEKLHNSRGNKGPFYIGLLNGLMPCGPLQMMQLYALGTGSIMLGALSMLVYSLGTVPLMLGLGALSTLLGKKYTHKVMKVSAALVIILGIMMMGRGLSLSGITIAAKNTVSQSIEGIARLDGDIQVVTSSIGSRSYAPVVVQKGIPVRWAIKADKQNLNGCNNAITIPEYGIEKKLMPGDNIIEFTPQKTGNITFTCWMGMITSNIKVVDNVNEIDPNKMKKEIEGSNPAKSSGGGCCN